VQLAEAVVELLERGEPFSEANLERTYVARLRASWVDRELGAATRARAGFGRGLLWGLSGMALAGFTGGRWSLRGSKPSRVATLEEFYRGRIDAGEIARIRRSCQAEGKPLHDTLMDRAGWPAIAHDGQLLVTHQDALLMGGKVQAPGGYADHVTFDAPALCAACRTKPCVEMCSGEAITAPPAGGVHFDREKCVHCGACLWNCPDTNLRFAAGTGGLHSVEN
jgi:electron-transferring-flavoprotein dehydrogenase